MKTIISTNPAKNYEKVGEVTVSTPEEIKKKVKQANAAKEAWQQLGVRKRVELLLPIYEEFNARQDEIARLIVDETGKVIRNARSEASVYVEGMKWSLDHAKEALADEPTSDDGKHRIVYEPWGTAAAISPWNYPFGMAMWGIIPNLIAGNTVVFKISEECPLMGKFIEGVMNNHDLPWGVFSEVYGAGDVGHMLAEDEVDLIWFTGSTKVGKLLYKIAADKFIKVILEMGGSNPFIAFEDADIKAAAELIYEERYNNCGQVCDATKRLIVHESIFDELVSELKSVIESKQLGDPNDEASDLASLVAERQLKLLEAQVADAVEKGAKIITGGEKADLPGAYYKPTLLTNITRDMRVWKEEVFGPVLPVIAFKTEEEAIELANDTEYGLGSRVFLKDMARARRVAAQIKAGTVEINQASRWIFENPFGGYKHSGMGREHGIVGFKELCQIKVISED